MAEHWIANAVGKPGALHRQLGVPQGQPIPAAKLSAAEHSSNPLERKRADLAHTLEGMHRADGGSMQPGRNYITGERGTEMIQMHPQGGATVVPHHAMKKQMVRDLIGKMLMQGGKGTQPEQQPGTATVAGVQK